MAWLYLLYEGDSAQRLWTQWIGTFSEDDDDDDGEAGARASTRYLQLAVALMPTETYDDCPFPL